MLTLVQVIHLWGQIPDLLFKWKKEGKKKKHAMQCDDEK